MSQSAINLLTALSDLLAFPYHLPTQELVSQRRFVTPMQVLEDIGRRIPLPLHQGAIFHERIRSSDTIASKTTV